MSKQILSLSQGTTSYFLNNGEQTALHTVADVEPIIDLATRLRNEGHTRAANGDRHLAEIPIIVLNQWAIERGTTFDAVMKDVRLLKEFMRDPANSAFRIDKGRV